MCFLGATQSILPKTEAHLLQQLHYSILILSKSRSVRSLEEDNIKLLGCKATKGIPKSNKHLSEETRHTNCFTFDRHGRKRWQHKRGQEKDWIKLWLIPRGRCELKRQFRITGGPGCKVSFHSLVRYCYDWKLNIKDAYDMIPLIKNLKTSEIHLHY